MWRAYMWTVRCERLSWKRCWFVQHQCMVKEWKTSNSHCITHVSINGQCRGVRMPTTCPHISVNNPANISHDRDTFVGLFTYTIQNTLIAQWTTLNEEYNIAEPVVSRAWKSEWKLQYISIASIPDLDECWQKSVLPTHLEIEGNKGIEWKRPFKQIVILLAHTGWFSCIQHTGKKQ